MCKLKNLKIGDGLKKKGNMYQNGKPTLSLCLMSEPVFDVLTICQVCTCQKVICTKCKCKRNQMVCLPFCGCELKCANIT